jgi:hypothetical protein
MAEFGRWPALSEKRHHALAAADRVAGNLQERRRNRELLEETLGWRVLDSVGKPVGRVTTLSETEGGRWEVQVLFEEPRRERSGNTR